MYRNSVNERLRPTGPRLVERNTVDLLEEIDTEGRLADLKDRTRSLQKSAGVTSLRGAP